MFEQLMTAVKKYIPDDTSRREIIAIARALSNAADDAKTETEEIKAHVETALTHLDDMARFGWPDRLDEAIRELAAAC